MIGSIPNGKPADPKTYLATVVAILMEYPPEIVEIVTDPVRGVVTKSEFLPSPKALTDALVDAMKPHNTAWIAEWKRRNEPEKVEYEKPTPEQRVRVEKVLEGLKDLGKKDPLQDLRDKAFQMQAERFNSVVKDAQKNKSNTIQER